MEKKLKIGLALGSGGMCGMAHIGFLEVLEENGIKIDMISGISMGSIIGGLYASGVTISEIKNHALKLTKNDIIELNMFRLIKQSLFSNKKFEKYLDKLLKIKNIEEAKIEYFAQATDLLTGKLYTFEKGLFVDAMLASSAIPGIFPAISKNDTLYIDGGVIEEVPFKILKEKGADVIIAVNCLNEYSKEHLPKNSFNTISTAFEIAQNYLWKHTKELEKDYYDIYCFDNTLGVNPLSVDFNDVKATIESGRKAAEKYITDIKKIIKEKQKNL